MNIPVPNTAPVAASAIFLTLPFVTPVVGWSDVVSHFLFTLAVALPVLVLGRWLGYGLGALKLMLAITLWFGPTFALLEFLLLGRVLLFLHEHAARRFPSLDDERGDVPVVPAATIAFAIALWHSPIWPGLAALAG